MDILLFIVKYIPFWAVPMCMIAGQFAYIFWLKSIRRLAVIFGAISVFCFFAVIFYYWVGGPDRAADYFLRT